MIAAALDEFDATGRIWFRDALSAADLSELDRVCATDQAPGARIAKRDDIVAALVPVNRLMERLAPGAKPVRVIAFNKSEAGNWALPWHQDRV